MDLSQNYRTIPMCSPEQSTMTTPLPAQLSDIHFSDATTNPNIYQTLKYLKKSTLSIHNRLRSILTDAEYITNTIHSSFPHLPLIANERCGSWYIPPDLKSGSAYFKSTDGHYGYWDFSLRRLNLQVLEVVGRSGGAVLIDSTRRGKRMPDALRRTVPVWIMVWNRVLFAELVGVKRWRWAFELQHPGLELGEVRLIEAKVEEWVDGLDGLGLNIVELKRKIGRPMKLCWVVQGEAVPEIDFELNDHNEGEGDVPRREEYNLLVLCSASRRVLGAEMSEDGYIQGAGDDAESWSGGLTPNVFWKHKDELMDATEEELSELMAKFLEEANVTESSIEAVQIKPTQNMFLAAGWIPPEVMSALQFDLIVSCNGKQSSHSPILIELGCRSGKLGSRDLREKLTTAIEHVTIVLRKHQEAKVLIICENGKDLSVGVTVTLLCTLYDDTGRLTIPSNNIINKSLVKKRLAWITSVKPDANPSRSTLQAVNSFLM